MIAPNTEQGTICMDISGHDARVEKKGKGGEKKGEGRRECGRRQH